MKKIPLRLLIMLSKYGLIALMCQCIFFSLAMSATSNAQKIKNVKEVYVEVAFDEATLNEVFTSIETLTDYQFLYHQNDVENHHFTLTSSRLSVADLLLKVSKETRLGFRQNNENIIVKKLPKKTDVNSSKSSAVIQVADITVTGSVTSAEDGESLPGVNIIEKGTTNGTVTDLDGNYRITVSDGATLIFSSIGFTKEEVAIGGRSVINMELSPDIQALSEIVVIGYGSVKKTDLTGSVASISGEELKKVPVASVDMGLQGRAPGVQVTQASSAPGGAVTVRIRGGNSVNSGNEPLYVVDGFPIYNDNDAANAPTSGYNTQSSPNALSFLNPNDIESIEILKDATATSIYGSRGANGVVLITTKRGKEGDTRINYDGYYGLQSVIKKIDVLNGQEFAEFHNQAAMLDGVDPIFNGVLLPTPEEIGEGTNWQEEIFQVAPMQNHQLSFTGGSKTTQYAISLNYFDQEGVVIGSRYRRGSIRTNLDLNPIEHLKFGTSLTYTYAVNDITQSESMNTGQTQGIIGSSLFNAPNATVYNDDGNFYSFRDIPPNANFRFQDNPVALATTAKDRGLTNRFLGNMYAQYELAEGLIFKVTLGADLLNNNRNTYFPLFTKVGDLNNGLASQGTRTISSWLNENTLSYNKKLGESHEFGIVAGYTYQEQINAGNQMTSTQFINDILEENNIGAGAAPGIPSSSKSKWQLASWLGRINYTLMGKYLFTFSGRADGSSRFGAGNKWAFFPSIAGAWRISDEPFLENSSLISDLKLRVSYGITGNTEIPVYQSLARLGISNYNINGSLVTGIAPTAISNPDLKWETTSMLNIGVDAGLFDNRLTFTANYYYNKTEDLLFNVTIPITSGFSSTFKNAGSLENRGIELGISSNVLVGAFKWDTQINWSLNRNEILDIGESDAFNAQNVSSGYNVPGSRIDVGLPIGAFWGNVSNGIYNTLEEIAEDPWANEEDLGDYRYLDLNDDGLQNTDDRTVIGDPNPDFVWSWNNNFSYKNFDLNVFINAVQGADIFNPHFGWLGGQRPRTNNLLRFTTLDTWSPENPDAEYGRASNSGNGASGISDLAVFDGSFIRLRSVSLGYTIPTKNSVFRNARVYVTGQNLFTISDYWGFDPEVNTQGQNNLNQGIDVNAYPKARTFMLGVNIGF